MIGSVNLHVASVHSTSLSHISVTRAYRAGSSEICCKDSKHQPDVPSYADQHSTCASRPSHPAHKSSQVAWVHVHLAFRCYSHTTPLSEQLWPEAAAAHDQCGDVSRRGARHQQPLQIRQLSRLCVTAEAAPQAETETGAETGPQLTAPQNVSSFLRGLLAPAIRPACDNDIYACACTSTCACGTPCRVMLRCLNQHAMLLCAGIPCYRQQRASGRASPQETRPSSLVWSTRCCPPPGHLMNGRSEVGPGRCGD